MRLRTMRAEERPPDLSHVSRNHNPQLSMGTCNAMHMSIHMYSSSRSCGKRIRRKGKCVHVNLDNTTIARHHDNYPAVRM
jgi:hypothetical protein